MISNQIFVSHKYGGDKSQSQARIALQSQQGKRKIIEPYIACSPSFHPGSSQKPIQTLVGAFGQTLEKQNQQSNSKSERQKLAEEEEKKLKDFESKREIREKEKIDKRKKELESLHKPPRESTFNSNHSDIMDWFDRAELTINIPQFPPSIEPNQQLHSQIYVAACAATVSTSTPNICTFASIIAHPCRPWGSLFRGERGRRAKMAKMSMELAVFARIEQVLQEKEMQIRAWNVDLQRQKKKKILGSQNPQDEQQIEAQILSLSNRILKIIQLRKNIRAQLVQYVQKHGGITNEEEEGEGVNKNESNLQQNNNEILTMFHRQRIEEEIQYSEAFVDLLIQALYSSKFNYSYLQFDGKMKEQQKLLYQKEYQEAIRGNNPNISRIDTLQCYIQQMPVSYERVLRSQGHILRSVLCTPPPLNIYSLRNYEGNLYSPHLRGGLNMVPKWLKDQCKITFGQCTDIDGNIQNIISGKQQPIISKPSDNNSITKLQRTPLNLLVIPFRKQIHTPLLIEYKNMLMQLSYVLYSQYLLQSSSPNTGTQIQPFEINGELILPFGFNDLTVLQARFIAVHEIAILAIVQWIGSGIETSNEQNYQSNIIPIYSPVEGLFTRQSQEWNAIADLIYSIRYSQSILLQFKRLLRERGDQGTLSNQSSGDLTSITAAFVFETDFDMFEEQLKRTVQEIGNEIIKCLQAGLDSYEHHPAVTIYKEGKGEIEQSKMQPHLHSQQLFHNWSPEHIILQRRVESLLFLASDKVKLKQLVVDSHIHEKIQPLISQLKEFVAVSLSVSNTNGPEDEQKDKYIQAAPPPDHLAALFTRLNELVTILGA
ncbi:MAG: hypothetical protein EZS28_021368 [Streblomastix strix]|uniref:Uncharacterized protein n=1 Tax=Streblomastix strix TaxID=222440 RepID=A0A5J4VKV2_9EUKA|nr:MAG: hypothetical protein EZS28_021368 [Streblomastix strix]